MQRIMTAVLLFFVCTTFFNCDIPGYIVITNNSNGIVTYKYDVLDGDSIKTYVIKINNAAKQNKGIIMFGFGQFWTDERIREYLSTISRIEITTSKETTVLTDKEEMFTYFKKQRGGILNHSIKIKVK